MLFVIILCQSSYQIFAKRKLFALLLSSILTAFISKTNNYDIFTINIPVIVSSITIVDPQPLVPPRPPADPPPPDNEIGISIQAQQQHLVQLQQQQQTGSNCDIVLHSSKSKNGTFMTPLFPAAYPARSFCRIEFQGEGRERVQIIFFEFSLPSDGENYNCLDSDNLQVLIPIRRRYEPVETLCGDQTLPKPILSDGPKMLLEFRGRRSGKGNRGFKAEYKFVENFGIISGQQLPDGECSFAFNASSDRNGWFHSPNFPGSYPRNLICNYYFYGEPNDKVLIRFTYFDVEGIYPCEDDSASDYVEFSNFMSVDRKYRKYCGKQNGFPLESDGRFFRITFHTNDRFDKTGFRASYQFVAASTTTEGTTATRSIQKNNTSIKNNSDNLSTIAAAFCIIYRHFIKNS